MNFFQQIAPVLNVCILVFWLIALYSARRDLRTSFAGITKGEWFALGAALLCAGVMQSFCELKHLIYIDEFWYLDAGKNILQRGMAPGFNKSIGWPVMVTFSYIFGGINNYSPIWLNLLLGLLCVPLTYFAARALTENKTVAAAAALTMALLPYRAVWAASAETGIPALFFVLWGVFMAALYYRSGSTRSLLAAAGGFALAAQIRPENLMFFGLFWAGKLLFSPTQDRRQNVIFYLASIAAIIVNLPNFSIFAAFQSSTNWLEVDSFGQMKGASISLANLWFNTTHWGPKFFNLSLHGALFSALFMGGAALSAKKNWRVFAFLALWAGMMYGFYFSTWFHVYGTTTALFPKTKLYMLFYPVLGIWAGYAVSWFAEKGAGMVRLGGVLMACALLWNAGYAKKAEFSSAPRALETRLLARLPKTVPESCMIITNSPVMVTASSFFRTVYTPHFTTDAAYAANLLSGEPCLLYLRDITTELGIKEFNEADREMAARYALKPRAVFSLRNKTYSLLAVSRHGAQTPAGKATSAKKYGPGGNL